MTTPDRAVVKAAILALTSFAEGWHAWDNADVIECTLLGGIDRPLTLTHLDAALAELKQLRAERDGRLAQAYANGWIDAIAAYRAPGWAEREAAWKTYREAAAAEVAPQPAEQPGEAL